MQNFRRSLKYLWPYRFRLGVSIVCVILIAVLWGGGLGMMLPGLKVLFSQEGLHGWAWTTLTEDRLEATIVQRMVPAQIRIEGQAASLVVDVIDVKADSNAAAIGLKKNDWIIGLDDGNADHRLLRADALTRALANAPVDQPVRLRVYDQFTDTVRTMPVELPEARSSAWLLGRLAGMLPEPRTRPDRWILLLWLSLITVGLTWLRDVLRFSQEYLVTSTALLGLQDLRCANYDVVLRLPTTFFARKGTSDTVSRFITDAGELTAGQITLLGKTLVEPAKAAAAIALAMILSWKLTLMTLVVGPPAYFLIRGFGKVMKRTSKRALESGALLLAVLNETLRGIRVVKAYTMETTERKRFRRIHRQVVKQRRRMARIEAATAPSIEAMGITAGSGAILVAGWWVLTGKMSAELFMTWVACLAAMFDPVRKLAKVATRFQRAEAAATRIFELQDMEQEKIAPNASTLPRHAESIEFRNVTYRYPGAEVDAVKAVNLTIRRNESIAVVGPNGSGKTTLVSLIPRLIDSTDGRILIDGQDFTQVSMGSLRRQVGLVTQETVVFNATIGENISYGLRSANEEAVLSAAKRAYVDEFVPDLPEAYDTMVGEQGATLSGGQRQRITIARAILRDPAILIFDEATSQIDADSEHRIHQAMDEFMRDRTTIMIAHRFATVMSADRIVVMDAGAIVDVGSHDELIDRCTLYAHLYNTQFSDTGG